MNLFEYQGKDLYKKYSITTPKSIFINSISDLTENHGLSFPLVVKAQVQVGGRGKAGGIKVAKNHQELEEHIDAILGMDIKPFGDNTYIIRSIPHVLSTQNPIQAFKNMISVLEEGKHFETWEEKAAYSIACHGAIRAGKHLSLLEMETLIRQLENCRQPSNCPHGRPTMRHGCRL